MTADVIPFPKPKSDLLEELKLFLNSQPLPFTHAHCKPARMMLGWSVDALAFRSGVSPAAIRRVEEGAELRRIP